MALNKPQPWIRYIDIISFTRECISLGIPFNQSINQSIHMMSMMTRLHFVTI
ncbi:hypothetical protein SAMD00019534_031860, partial [Acytostelium subglobosum LB1]|uniref:hypothetical protein n=1 Tax=Acytostelium subglobosum LB1 TaxID=1410327 RepID=UPI000644A667